MINNAPNRNKGAVFQIVALKTCKDAEISSKGSETKSRSTDIKPPVKELATAAAHGVPPPINPDVPNGALWTNKVLVHTGLI